MLERTERRSGVDQRTGYDRRKSRQFDLSGTYFIENREKSSQERRATGERREGYTLVSKWHGSMIGVEINL